MLKRSGYPRLHVLATLSLLGIIVLGSTFPSPGMQADAAPDPPDGLRIGIHDQTGKATFIGANPNTPFKLQSAAVEGLLAEDRSMQYLDYFSDLLGLSSPQKELLVTRQSTLKSSRGDSVRYQQTYQGIPILAGELIVNTDSRGGLLSISGEISPDLSLSVEPTVMVEEAGEIALGVVSKGYGLDSDQLTVSDPELWIFDERLLKSSERPAELVWRMEVRAMNSEPINELVLVNAQTGGISLHFNQIDTAWSGNYSFTTKTEEPISTDISQPIPAQNTAANPVSIPTLNGGNTWYVSTTGDDSNDCATTTTECASINGALGKAGFVAGDTINVAEGTYTGTGSEVITIDFSVNIQSGWDSNFTTQAGISIIDGEGARMGIAINSGDVTLRRLWIRNGYSDCVGGIQVSGATLTLDQSTVSDNRTYGQCGAGGIDFFPNSDVSLINTTITNNTGREISGSIDNTMLIANSTIGDGVNIGGGDPWFSPSLIIQNSIIADSGGDCGIHTYVNQVSNGHNLIEYENGCGFSATTGDLFGIDPIFGPFIDDIGLQIISPNSPAIDAGNPAAPGGGGSACEVEDQRGISRPVDGDGVGDAICDIGAHEYTIPGSPVSILAIAGSSQRTPLGSRLWNPLEAAVLDDAYALIPGVVVTFTAPGSGASGTFKDSGTNMTAVLTDAGGIATSPAFTANDVAGGYVVSAEVSGVGTPADFHVDNFGWYVSSASGDDANDCESPSTPCSTINGAFDKTGFLEGDTVLVSSGTYAETSGFVVYIDENARLIGGWNSDFTSQSGTSIVDGEGTKIVVYTGVGIRAEIDRFTIQNGFNGNFGGVLNWGNLRITSCTISQNHGAGGITNASTGTLIMEECVVENNSSTVLGSDAGGLGNSGIAYIISSTIRNNHADDDGGGIRNGGTLTLNTSTVSGNHAGGDGGGIFNAKELVLNNSTISGNSATDRGGGIYTYSSDSSTSNNTTIAYNKSLKGGGIYIYYGKPFSMGNSIIANNRSATTGPDCDGELESTGYNLLGESTDCMFSSTTGDVVDIAAYLAPLGDFGGLTRTHPILRDSPGLDTANPATPGNGGGACEALDQRGIPRPVDGDGDATAICDMGSFEYTGIGSIPINVLVFDGAPQYTKAGGLFSTSLKAVVLDSAGQAVPGTTVTFTAPTSGASGAFSGSGTYVDTAITDVNGIAVASDFTANETIGDFSVEASVAGILLAADFELGNGVDRLTYSANHTTNLPGALLCDASQPDCTDSVDPNADAVHQHAADTYIFYYNHHGRNSLDDAGMTIVSSVHYYYTANVYWDPFLEQVVYGDGSDIPLADDIGGHELTHGVTQHSSNLFYYYQSGAINESFSDLWGEFIDLTNGRGNDTPGVRWYLGEDIAGIDGVRNMADPPEFDQPDKITSPNYYVGSADLGYFGDNGGVHTNSGVNNKAVYLMTDGGSFNGQTVTSLGIDKVAVIYYEVQTSLLTSGSDYGDLYNTLYQGCLNLVGGAEGITTGNCDEVRDASDAVEMNLQPVPGYNPEAEICSTGKVPSDSFFDDFEAGAGNWTFEALTGTSSWTLATGYATSGTKLLWGDDTATLSDSVSAMNADVALPSGSQPYLHFNHAFGFEDPDYDGAFLEYSTDGGGNWTDAGPLIDSGLDYTGNISDPGDIPGANPNRGHIAFIADSHGYVSTRYDLSSLAGEDVRFRWRVSTDVSFFDWGWFVDDVRIYTCLDPVTYQLYLPLIMR
jgi:Zn-dependent metalloprotease